jgi:hypothetical protein
MGLTGRISSLGGRLRTALAGLKRCCCVTCPEGCCACGDCCFPIDDGATSLTVTFTVTKCVYNDADCTDLREKQTYAGTVVLTYNGCGEGYDPSWEGYLDADIWVDESPTSCDCEHTGEPVSPYQLRVTARFQCNNNKWVLNVAAWPADMWEYSNGGFDPDFVIPGDCNGGEVTTPILGSIEEYDYENEEWNTIYYECRYTPPFYSTAIGVASITVDDNDCMAV